MVSIAFASSSLSSLLLFVVFFEYLISFWEKRSFDELLIDDRPRRSLSSMMTAISLRSMRVAFRKASHMEWQILLATGMPTETLSR